MGVTATVQNIAFDCADPYALAQFWSQVTGQPLSAEDHPGDPEPSIDPPRSAAERAAGA